MAVWSLIYKVFPENYQYYISQIFWIWQIFFDIFARGVKPTWPRVTGADAGESWRKNSTLTPVSSREKPPTWFVFVTFFIFFSLWPWFLLEKNLPPDSPGGYMWLLDKQHLNELEIEELNLQQPLQFLFHFPCNPEQSSRQIYHCAEKGFTLYIPWKIWFRGNCQIISPSQTWKLSN